FMCWSVYFIHSRTFGRARPSDVGEAIAWRIPGVLAAFGVLVMGVWLIVAVLDATVWANPDGQRPAPLHAPGPLDFVAAAAIVAFIVVPSLLRLLGWLRGRLGRSQEQG